MKTTILSTIIFLVAGVNILMAAGTNHSTFAKTTTAEGTEFIFVRPEIIVNKLAPVTPKVVEFEEMELLPQVNIVKLAPVIPAKPDFEEISGTEPVSMPDLAPSTPSEADFND